MTASTRAKLLVAGICLFFVCIGLSIFATPHLPSRDIWNTVICGLGFLDVIAIYFIVLRSTNLFTKEARRTCDVLAIAFLLVAIAATVCIFWLGTSDWAAYPNVTRANFFWGIIVAVGAFLWIQQSRKSGRAAGE